MNDLKEKRIIIAGGTGLVGACLTKALRELGAEVQVLSRNAHSPGTCAWESLPELLEGSHAIINLAGAGIADERWSPARKALLRQSRLEPTERILEALASCTARPNMLVNASAVGIYGAQREEILDESQPLGEGFLAELCRDWEAAADRAGDLGLRVVKLRIGVVLAREGGALPRIAQPVRLFAGTILGSGRQGFSWIHIEDLVRLILESLKNPAFEGAFNATAPLPCTHGAFTRLLAQHLHRPIWPAPALVTRAALKLLVGEMAEPMLLGGVFASPRKALELGFTFRFPNAEKALEDLL